MYISWTDTNCPRCKARIGSHLGSRDAVGQRIGEAQIACPRCHLKLQTGAKEWFQFTPQERRDFLYPKLDGVILATGIVFALVGGRFGMVSLGCIFVGLAFYSAVPISKLLAIHYSKKRSRRQFIEGK